MQITLNEEEYKTLKIKSDKSEILEEKIDTLKNLIIFNKAMIETSIDRLKNKDTDIYEVISNIYNMMNNIDFIITQ